MGTDGWTNEHDKANICFFFFNQGSALKNSNFSISSEYRTKMRESVRGRGAWEGILYRAEYANTEFL
jgi:hypothetical protein